MPYDAASPGKTDAEILKESRERLRDCVSANAIERAKQLDDLRFCTLDQWPSDVRNARENDPYGPRPCLTVDQSNQYIQQVVNDCRQKRPAIKVRPVDSGADVETAAILQGVVRQIEDQSQASIAYDTAVESAVRVGEGYFRFITEYEDSMSFNQVIRIKRIPNFMSVYLGPHVMPDGSDAEYGYVLEPVPVETFKRDYPGKKWEAVEFEEVRDANVALNWGDAKEVLVAEYFYTEYTPIELLYLADGQTMTEEEYSALPDDGFRPEVTDRRRSQKKQVRWCKHTGVEVLDKRDWAGKYIPIVKVIGKESWVDGKRIVWGLVRPAKDVLRAYNYWMSTLTEKLGMAPKVPFVGAKGQFEGVEDRWQNANKVNYPYLEYNPVDVNGQPVPPPQRQGAAPVEAGYMQFMVTLAQDVQRVLGMFKAALGQEQPQQSGRAILALTRESDTGTFHFPDNQSIGIQYGGRIMIDLIPKVYDTARILRILGEDGEMKQVEIDPEQEESVVEVRDEETGEIRRIYNPNIGNYDVTATTGPSYNTRRMESAQVFTDLANSAKDPLQSLVFSYLAIRNSDFDESTEAAGMVKKLLPPQVLEDDTKPPVPPQVAAQMQQLTQVVQALGQENQTLKSGAAEAQAKIKADYSAKLAQIESDKAVDNAKIKADHDVKMQALALQDTEAAEAAHIARKKAADEIELKRWIAEQEIALKGGVAAADVALEQRKAEHQQVLDRLDGFANVIKMLQPPSDTTKQ